VIVKTWNLTKNWLLPTVLLCANLVVAGMSQAKPASTRGLVSRATSLDDQFISLRSAALSGDLQTSKRLAVQLADHDIPSYVEYYRLRANIRAASSSEIRDFLSQYDGSAIADRLRNDWLLDLGLRRDWATFDEQFPRFALADDTQVKCYALLSKAMKGKLVAPAARELLQKPKEYGEACVALIAALAEQQQLNLDELWQQVRIAVEFNALGTARQLAAILEVPDKAMQQALDSPSRTVVRGPGIGRVGHELYVLALGRLARSGGSGGSSGISQAAQNLQESGNKLPASLKAQAWAQLALPAAINLAPEAAQYWTRTQGALLSTEGYQWRVRSALRIGDWKQVKTAIEAMPATLRTDPAWVYWYARALKQHDSVQAAQAQWQSIAGQTNFYGQLALEELGQKITIPTPAAAPDQAEMSAMRANKGLQRSMRFFAMGLRFEATREWNWELRQFSEREHLAAAELAREHNILDRMVNTSDRTKTEFDFTQRFPSPHHDIMQVNTQTLGLDKAWVYGLIRQESRFILNARSSVGASGLMQLMPGTARFVAQKIGLTGFAPDRVNDIRTNILLGTNYLNMVLGNLNGSQTLATAAYNAGPGRPRSWRSSLTGPVEGAIFAETIPFTETRGYVKNVLSNATYYAALFQNQPQSLKARLGMVAPSGVALAEAP
jgi:soluble lytic murein transglycosylase